MASKFEKPAEEPPKKPPVAQKKVGSLNNKFGKFDSDSGTPDKKSPPPAAKPPTSAKPGQDKKEVVSKQDDKTTTQVTVEKSEIPGGEIVSKKTVSVSKSPDGSVTTKTTKISTTGVVDQKSASSTTKDPKPATLTKPSLGQKKPNSDGDGKTTQVTVQKKDIPGGEMVSKKVVSTSKTADGVKTTTTTISTSGVTSEEKSSVTTNGAKPSILQKKTLDTPGKGKKTEVTVGKTEIPGGEIITKKTVSVSKTPDGSVTSKTTTISTTEEKSSSSTKSLNGMNGTSEPSGGKKGADFLKKLEATDKKKMSPKPGFGIGGMKDKFQGNGVADKSNKFGRGKFLYRFFFSLIQMLQENMSNWCYFLVVRSI